MQRGRARKTDSRTQMHSLRRVNTFFIWLVEQCTQINYEYEQWTWNFKSIHFGWHSCVFCCLYTTNIIRNYTEWLMCVWTLCLCVMKIRRDKTYAVEHCNSQSTLRTSTLSKCIFSIRMEFSAAHEIRPMPLFLWYYLLIFAVRYRSNLNFLRRYHRVVNKIH